MDPSTLLHFFSHYGLLVLYLWLLVGIFIVPVPEEVVMLTVGILISRGDFSFFALPVACIGSLCGVTVSYFLGRSLGSLLVAKYGRWVGLNATRFAQGEALFERRGKWSLPIGYFVPGMRHLVSLVAGTTHFPWRRFALYAYPAGVVWVTLLILLGYLAGDYWLQLFHLAARYIYYAIILLAAALIVGMLFYWQRRSRIQTRKGHDWMLETKRLKIRCLTPQDIDPLSSVYRLELLPYNPQWPVQFVKEVERITPYFADVPIAFHHIGSTSIPGCSAKPILDILGVTTDIWAIDSLNEELIEAGYTPLGEFGIKQRRFFRKGKEVHLHIFEETDPEVTRYLRFRNYLRTHLEEAANYSKLKSRLIQKDPADRKGYVIGKTPFVKSIDYAALQGSEWNPVKGPRKQQWTEEQIHKVMEANMHLHMTYFAKYMPDLEILSEPDVIAVRSSIPDDTFNYILAAQFSSQNLTTRVGDLLNHYKELPFSWWVGEGDSPEALTRELENQSLEMKEDDIGMYLLLDEASLSRWIPELEIQRIVDQEGWRAFASIFVSLGGYLEIYEAFFAKIPSTLYGEGAPYEGYVGYIDGVPVVTGVLVLHANTAGIYYVMTRPEQRRKGFGTEMLVALLLRAQQLGYHLATLQASASGRSLYERLGFRSLCRFVEYAPLEEDA